MDFTSPPRPTRPPPWPPGSSRTAPPRAAARSRPTATGSTPSCGRSWPTPGCSVSPSPRRTAAPGSGSSSCAACSSRSAARSPRCRSPRTGPPRLLLAEQGGDQKQAWLSGAASGARRADRAVAEDLEPLPPRPPTTAEPADDGWTAQRHQDARPAGTRCRRCSWSPATTPSGTGVFLVEPGTDGVTVLPSRPATATSPRGSSSPTPRASAARGRPTPAQRLGQLARRSPPAPSSSASPRARCALTAAYAKDAGAVRPADRHLPGGLAAAGRRLHRHPRPGAHAVAGGLAARRGPARRTESPPPSSGRPTPATGSRTRPCTSTAASASTSTARPTATSPPPSGASSRSAAPPSRRCASAGAWPPSPPDSRRVTIRDLLLARAEQDTPALLTRERTWTWRELVADASARAGAARACSTRSALPTSGC